MKDLILGAVLGALLEGGNAEATREHISKPMDGVPGLVTVEDAHRTQGLLELAVGTREVRLNRAREVCRVVVSPKRNGVGAGLERHVVLIERGTTICKAHDGNAAIGSVHHDGNTAPALRAHAGSVLGEHAHRHEVGDVARHGSRRQAAHLRDLHTREGAVIDDGSHDAGSVGVCDVLGVARHVSTSKATPLR